MPAGLTRDGETIRIDYVVRWSFHFTRLHHRLEVKSVAQLRPTFAECRHRVDHHAHARHAAQTIPDGCFPG